MDIKPISLQGNGLIQKATGIHPHVMLLVSIQKVINAQCSFLLKMKQVINDEFDKREVGHSRLHLKSI